jgi:hypothetical protein
MRTAWNQFTKTNRAEIINISRFIDKEARSYDELGTMISLLCKLPWNLLPPCIQSGLEKEFSAHKDYKGTIVIGVKKNA